MLAKGFIAQKHKRDALPDQLSIKVLINQGSEIKMKRILSVILAVVTVLNVITLPVAAADPVSCVVSVYNDRNGLPTGEANAVVQTPDGWTDTSG